MPAILAAYRNGNYRVTLFADGTKIKRTEEDEFRAEFPDSIDLKITDYCENDCPMCHESSSTLGRHGNLRHPIVDTFVAGIEVAIGGGNPLSHPDLVPFLERLRSRGIIANLTVNEIDLAKQQALVEGLLARRLVHGLGVSTMRCTADTLAFAEAHPNVVLHLICGVYPPEEMELLRGKGLKVLLLGYKRFGKGATYHSPRVEANIRVTAAMLPELLRAFAVVSFDNLALEQLGVRAVLGDDYYESVYMGADGEASMYVDLVAEQYALSSTSTARADLLPDLKQCFQRLPR